MEAEVRVERVSWAEAETRLRHVREAVFVHEQGIPLALELDGLDPGACHVLACTGAGDPVGAARMKPDGHIGRMAVLAPWRRRGIGRLLLAALIEEARAQGLTEVHLNAQLEAVGFYERCGFQAVGEPFLEAGIGHRRMRRGLR